MTNLTDKLKNSKPTIVDPKAKALISELVSRFDDYVLFSSQIFKKDVLNEFIDLFLHTHAYIGSSDGTKIPDYQPFHIAYSEDLKTSELGKAKVWLGYWSNCFVLYSEYEEHESVTSFFIDKETYEKAVQVKGSIDDLFPTRRSL